MHRKTLANMVPAVAIALAVGALGACSAGSGGDATSDGDDAISGEAALTAPSGALRPTSDVASSSVVGVGDTASLFKDVDDTVSDDSTTYVRGAAGSATGSHTVGYASSSASGAVSTVKVVYRAQRGSAKGTAQVLLYDGATLLGSGKVNTLGAWANYSDTFTGLSVADASTLRTKLVFTNTSGNGALRYTQIWIELPPPDAGAVADSGGGADAADAADAGAGGGSGEPGFPLRAAFYYGWFPETWGLQNGSAFTNYDPSLGYYDTNTVVAQHVREMLYAKIQAGIATWWGQGTKTDGRIPNLLRAADGTAFKWSLYHEGEGVGDPTVAQLTSDLVYVRDHYGKDPNFLRVNGRPVVFVYADANDGCGMADRWKQANATVGAYVVLKVFPGYATCASQPDEWHQYSPAVATDQQGSHSYVVSPGFWKSGEAAPRLTRDPARWAQDIRNMIASGARLQLVTTFNEWGEGTAVESATEWASASGHGVYLDALHADGNVP